MFELDAFKEIKKPIYCPNAQGTSLDDKTVVKGSIVQFNDHPTNPAVFNYARVLGIATKDGLGNALKNSLWVLRLNNKLTTAYLYILDKKDIYCVAKPHDFMRWFLEGEIPSFEQVVKMSKHGSLSDPYMSKYMRTDMKHVLRSDWDVAFHNK